MVYFVTFQQQHCLFCPDTCSLDSCKNPSVTGFKNKYLVRQRDVCGSKLHARFSTRYVEVKSCRPLKNHLIYYHFLYELQASYGCENMIWKKDGNILPESYALVNFQFFPSLDIIDKYFSIFKDFYLSQNSQLFLFLANFLQYKETVKKIE